MCCICICMYIVTLLQCIIYTMWSTKWSTYQGTTSLAAELSWTPTMPAIQLLRSLPIKLLFQRQNGKFFRFSKIYWHSWIEFGLPASKISDINGCLKVVVPPLVVCRFFYRKKIHWNSWHVLSHFLQIFLFRAFLFFSRKSLSYSFFKQKSLRVYVLISSL